MHVEPFELERFQSRWENRVRHNLAESGVHPLTVRELLGPDGGEALLDERLVYSQTNGTEALRAAVAGLHAGASADNVLVCSGTAEANFVCLWRLLEPGDEVVAVLPNYMQIPGLARGFGARVVPVWLREEEAWSLDPDQVRRVLGPRTRAVAVCNPNNPTGAQLSEEARRALVEMTARAGVWLVADEVYRGAERDEAETPTLWGGHERVLVTAGLSKAYGLPGLRLGWVVGPAELVAELWGRRDYLTIAPATLSDALARRALAEQGRHRLRERTRALLLANDAAFEEWARGLGGALQWVPPRAGAIAFVRYAYEVGSTALADRLLREADVLVVPGDHFLLDGHLRIGLGNETGDLRAGLARMEPVLRALER